MIQALFAQHKKWRDGILRSHDPHAGQARTQVIIAHGKSDGDPYYAASLIHPSHWSLQDAMADEAPTPPLRPDQRHDEGRWLHLKPQDGDKPMRVYVRPGDRGNEHVVVGGAGDRLNGLALQGVRSPEDYDAIKASARTAKYAVGQQVNAQQQLAAKQLARKADDSAEEQIMLPERHVLPLTPPQATDYATTLHLLAQARADRDKHGLATQEILERLDPYAYTHARPAQVTTMLSSRLNQIEASRVKDALLAHPAGAKIQHIIDFAASHPEPIHVRVGHPLATQTLQMRLEGSGHKTTTEPDDWVGRGDQDPTARILLHPMQSSIDRLPEKHHVIHMDDVPVLAPDESRHLSHHFLVTDTDHERPMLDDLDRTQKFWQDESKRGR